MDKFIEEIKNLSRSCKDSINNKVVDSENNKALSILFKIAGVGVEIFNESGHTSVKLHKLPADLMPLFFNFHSDCSGFVIKTGEKFIFVMQSEQNNIFIYGLTSKDGVSIRQSLTRAVQLLNLEYKESKDGIKFYDNTAKEIQPEEVVLQLFRWGLN